VKPVTAAVNFLSVGTTIGKSFGYTGFCNWYVKSIIKASLPLYKILPDFILKVKLVLFPGFKLNCLKPIILIWAIRCPQ
jgi:hypothetical protein